MLKRLFSHCLIRPDDLQPSRDDLQVIGTFNPGAVALGEEVVLLVRVAEQPREQCPGWISLPRYDGAQIVFDHVADTDVERLDRRVVRLRADGALRLTFVSHLRVFRGRADEPDRVSPQPFAFLPATEYESFGVEDARITSIEGRYYFTYVSVSTHGACTSLASTHDFCSFERHGIIFPPENKDVLLFPSRIADRYVAMHRPNPAYKFAPPQMWLAWSDDLIHWGQHRYLLDGRGAPWSTGRIGGGCPPLATERGWLEIYHGNAFAGAGAPPGTVGAYVAAAFIGDRDDPSRIIAHSDGPILVPEQDFEQRGFLPDILFPTGILERDDQLLIYYGAADAHTGVLGVSCADLLEACR
jgi:beta-1,2-mannobiose phosphorylase / 1,2-beta-oligomannan phosphorylase